MDTNIEGERGEVGIGTVEWVCGQFPPRHMNVFNNNINNYAFWKVGTGSTKRRIGYAFLEISYCSCEGRLSGFSPSPVVRNTNSIRTFLRFCIAPAKARMSDCGGRMCRISLRAFAFR